jgi:hypothetical protein
MLEYHYLFNKMKNDENATDHYVSNLIGKLFLSIKQINETKDI